MGESALMGAMSQGSKRLAQMRNNPKNDWKISDIEVVCRSYDIILEPPSNGSHWAVFFKGVGILTIPVHGHIRPYYIKEFVAFTDKVKEVR